MNGLRNLGLARAEGMGKDERMWNTNWALSRKKAETETESCTSEYDNREGGRKESRIRKIS